MRTRLVLPSALLLAVGAASQQVPKSPAQAQCRFSDGSKITVTYSLDLQSYRLVTDGSLLAVQGVHVPAGDYAISPTKDSAANWILTMKKPMANKGISGAAAITHVCRSLFACGRLPSGLRSDGRKLQDVLEREEVRGGAFLGVHKGERRHPSC